MLITMMYKPFCVFLFVYLEINMLAASGRAPVMNTATRSPPNNIVFAIALDTIAPVCQGCGLMLLNATENLDSTQSHKI